MKNASTMRKYADRIEQACCKIERFFWIAGMIESGEFKELLNDEIEYIVENFSEKEKVAYYEHYQGEEMPFLLQSGKLGFLAELHFPRRYNFTFKDGEVSSCSVNEGNCRIEYAYGDTITELMKNIEKKAEKVEKDYIKADKKNETTT